MTIMMRDKNDNTSEIESHSVEITNGKIDNHNENQDGNNNEKNKTTAEIWISN